MKCRQETVYITDDGRKFFDDAEALKHELYTHISDENTTLSDVITMLFAGSTREYRQACSIIMKLQELKACADQPADGQG